ncbi:MAG TPA: hypothetical protein VFI36_08510 [Arthrobacter sp.]|nr:hypothetical protein [Arthrobacter sp.]
MWRDFQLHPLMESVHDGWLAWAAGEELESRTIGIVVYDADKLLHHRFRVVHEFGEPAADRGQER